MNTPAQTRQKLHEIHHMTRHLPDAIATILGIHANPTTTTSHIQPDPIGTILTQAHTTTATLDPLDQLATEWATTKSEQICEPVALYLAARTDWAATHWPGWDTAQHTINTVHRRLAHITGYAPERSNRHCPYCHEPLTRTPDTHGLPDIWSCATCDRAWHITDTHDTLADTQRALLAQTNVHVSRDQAATILGINRSTLRTWIRRGHLTETSDGISLADARNLAARH
ncbi:MAG: helix-turn-helix domain-containing protein [Actinomycetaceae bacterium]|nr:helix-turn-helix domain-containing protein [Actinomycetaceae bacterium]